MDSSGVAKVVAVVVAEGEVEEVEEEVEEDTFALSSSSFFKAP